MLFRWHYFALSGVCQLQPGAEQVSQRFIPACLIHFCSAEDRMLTLLCENLNERSLSFPWNMTKTSSTELRHATSAGKHLAMQSYFSA